VHELVVEGAKEDQGVCVRRGLHVHLTFPSLPPSLSPSLLQDEHPSLLLLLADTLRVASASVLLDLSQLPFLNVALCAMAGQGRLPALQVPPFQGFSKGFRAIVAAEVREGGREEKGGNEKGKKRNLHMPVCACMLAGCICPLLCR